MQNRIYMLHNRKLAILLVKDKNPIIVLASFCTGYKYSFAYVLFAFSAASSLLGFDEATTCAGADGKCTVQSESLRWIVHHWESLNQDYSLFKKLHSSKGY